MSNSKTFVTGCFLKKFALGLLNVIKFHCFGSLFKVGLSPSKKICVICLIESPLKMMKNAFYFILKALFVLMIFRFLSQLFGHIGKTA